MPSIVVPESGSLPPPRPQRSVRAGESARYFAASLLALAVDFAVLTALVGHAQVHYRLGAATGFVAGTVVAFVLSVTWVFEHQSFKLWTAGLAAFAAFAAVGAAGLLVSLAVMSAAVEWLHADYRLAKVGAAGASFVFNFTIRRALLFARPLPQRIVT